MEKEHSTCTLDDGKRFIQWSCGEIIPKEKEIFVSLFEDVFNNYPYFSEKKVIRNSTQQLAVNLRKDYNNSIS